MDWWAIISEILTGSFRIGFLITAIIILVALGMALLTDAHLLDRAAAFIQPIMGRLTLSSRAAFPLLAGFFLGIVIGSGVIISTAQDGSLTKRDLVLVLIFLGICHGVIEDTLVFVALGANGWIIILCRFLLAALAAFAVSFLAPLKPSVLRASIKK